MAQPRFWLAVGPPGNWQRAFSHGNIWGLKSGKFLEIFWELLNEDDLLLFYAGRPVSGVIGFARVKTKFKQEDTPLWDDEVEAGKVLYPLRIEFDPEFCHPPDTWDELGVSTESLKPLVRGGFQPLRANVALEVIQLLSPSWSPAPARPVPQAATSEAEIPRLTHDEVKIMLVEIGRIQKFLAEPEYGMDTGRLDVVWRRIDKSVPTYVFEVQVGGDIYHALAKLKHAYDLWNSHIFLVADPRERTKCDQLVGGSFHEIAGRLKFLPIEKVYELYQKKCAFKELEKQLDIPA